MQPRREGENYVDVTQLGMAQEGKVEVSISPMWVVFRIWRGRHGNREGIEVATAGIARCRSRRMSEG